MPRMKDQPIKNGFERSRWGSNPQPCDRTYDPKLKVTRTTIVLPELMM